MSGNEWWAPTLQKALSQGDVVSGIPFLAMPDPIVYLKKKTFKKGEEAWAEESAVQANGMAVIKTSVALVLSHSCELDKPRSGARVIVAAVKPIDSLGLSEDMREKVLLQHFHASLPLPEIPGLGTCVADLRSSASVPRNIVDSCARLASMTDSSLRRLGAQLVAFYTRLEMPHELATQIKVIDA